MLPPPPRRSHPRYTVHRLVTYRHQDKSALTFTLDLGLGGMKIQTQSHLPRGECLDFRLVLGSDSIRVKGRIVYTQFMTDQNIVTGVSFVDLSREDHLALQDYMTELMGWPKAPGTPATEHVSFSS